jgi:hypothetical protein
MENLQTAMLDVPVTPTGLLYLKKLVVGTRWTFALGLVMNLLVLADAGVNLAIVKPEKYSRFLPIYLFYRVNFWFILLTVAISMANLYIWRRFARRATEAVNVSDTEGFNESLLDLYRSNRLALTGIFLSIGFVVLRVWMDVWSVQRIMHMPT